MKYDAQEKNNTIGRDNEEFEWEQTLWFSIYISKLWEKLKVNRFIWYQLACEAKRGDAKRSHERHV